MKGASCLLLAALLGSAAAVRAGGIRDLEDGWILPPALVCDLLAAGVEGGPAPAAGSRGWLRCGQGRLHGLAELPLLGLEAGQRRGPLVVAGAWQRLGAAPYREESWRLRVGWGRRRRLWLGAGRHSLRLGEAALTAWQPEVGLEVAAAPWRLSLTLPLAAAPAWYGRGGARPWLAGAVAGRGAVLGLALDRQAGGAPVLQAEAAWRLGGGLLLGLRAEPSTGTLGPTLAWRRGGLLLRSSHLAHPDLGLTHRWSLGWGRPEGWR